MEVALQLWNRRQLGARRHQIPKPPKRFVSRVPFWARQSLSEQEKNKAPKQ